MGPSNLQNEESIRLSEDILRAIFNSRTYNIILIGRDGRIQAFNEGAARAAQEVQGVKYEVGQDFLSGIPEIAHAKVRERHERILAGESLRVETPFLGVDGIEHWYDLQYDPVRDSKGEITGICLTNVCVDDRKKAERALQKSEENLRAVFNSGAQMVALVGRDGVLQDFNRNAGFLLESILGKKFEVGRSFIGHLPEEFGGVFRERFERALQGEVISSERKVTASDGSEHWFEFTYNPVLDTKKSVTGVCMTGVLIDERKKAEEALRRSEANLRAVFNSGSHVAVLIGEDGRVRDFNKSAGIMSLRVLGIELKPGMLFKDTLPQGANPEAYRDGFLAALQGKESKGERSIRSADGQERWVEVNYQPVFNDRNGVEGVCFSLVFIDERKKAEVALKESEERYRKLVEFSPDAVLVHDGERLLFANSAAAQLFGAARSEDMVGLDVWRFVREEFRAVAVERVHKILTEKGSSPSMEQEWLRLDGTSIPIEVQGTYLTFRGRPAILVILRNITERRKTGLLLSRYERLATIGNVIAAIAHEIRNPLAVVSGMSQLLKTKLETRKEFSQELDTILQQSNRLKLFMNDILDYSRGMELQRIEVDPRVLMEQSLMMAQAQYGPQHAGIRVEWVWSDLPRFLADAGRLEQVLSNLILNAYQVLGTEGQIVLSGEVQDGRMLLGVEDDGPGIREADIPRLFEPFFTTKKKGSGLGLPISQKIVEAHEGKIKVIPKSPQGTLFLLEIPLRKNETPA